MKLWEVTHPHTPWKLKCKSKSENNERTRNWGLLINLQHFKGRGVCWSFEMGIRVNDKRVDYSHEPAQTKQQFG
jgi:hypothetical protein